MWGETLPSGRERAIETLVDMEPHGPFYRAARVLVRCSLDECVNGYVSPGSQFNVLLQSCDVLAVIYV